MGKLDGHSSWLTGVWADDVDAEFVKASVDLAHEGELRVVVCQLHAGETIKQAAELSDLRIKPCLEIPLKVIEQLVRLAVAASRVPAAAAKAGAGTPRAASWPESGIAATAGVVAAKAAEVASHAIILLGKTTTRVDL